MERSVDGGAYGSTHDCRSIDDRTLYLYALNCGGLSVPDCKRSNDKENDTTNVSEKT